MKLLAAEPRGINGGITPKLYLFFRISVRNAVNLLRSKVVRYLAKANKVFFAIGICLLTAGLVVIFFWPKTFVYQYPNSSQIEYLNIFSSTVWLFRIDPDCQKEITTGEPSPGFAISYHFCDKRWWLKYIVESKTISNNQTVYILKLEHPGEKGDNYRRKLVVENNQAYWDNQYAEQFFYQVSSFAEAMSRLLLAK